MSEHEVRPEFDILLTCMPHGRIGYIIAISDVSDYDNGDQNFSILRQDLDQFEWANSDFPWPDVSKPYGVVSISRDSITHLLDLIAKLQIGFVSEAGSPRFGATRYQISIDYRGLQVVAKWSSFSSIEQTGLPALCRAMQRMAGEEVH